MLGLRLSAQNVMPRQKICRPFLLLALSIFVICPAQAGSQQVYDGTSPPWLRAIGKLHVPGIKYEAGYQLHHREDCSATLITTGGTEFTAVGANTIITAWHCLESYRDVSKTITFTLFHGTDDAISFEAHRLADGGGMDADWAVLRLVTPVDSSLVSGLQVHPARADELQPVIMAGYSQNSPGKRLSYDPECHITSQTLSGKGPSESNCKALKGASGGAVVQLSSNGDPFLAGVISQGDGEQLSIFVPVKNFRSAIQASLK
jgi:hypothetical protein